MSARELERLRLRFDALLRRLGGGSGSFFDDLAKRYSEPRRSYHNLDHIARCLSVFDEVRHLAGRPDEVEAALYFHDVVSEAGADDNEEQSAILAARTLAAAGIDAATGLRIADLIRATTHRGRPGDPDARLVVDVDLAGLGDPEEEFLATGRRVRDEHSHVSDEDFEAGRREFLRAFLERPSIYATEHFRERLEERARANLMALLR